jgi:hypothetical protein
MKRLIAAAAVLACLARAACAGELMLFADSDFRGNQVTLHHDAPDLAEYGFNDRASSLVVRSGVWELCEHHDYGGTCARFGPGEYRQLPGFNDAISSVRELSRRRDDDDDDGGWRARRHDDWRDHDRGYRRWHEGEAVQMFSAPRFEGARVDLSSDLGSLDAVGFNDRASSIIIREGQWEFCEHSGFRGRCIVLGPGNYAFLDRMSNRISSMRRLR